MPVGGRERRVARGELRDDDRELAVRDERRAGVDPLPRREPAEPAGEEPDADLAENVATRATSTIQPTSPSAPRSIVSANAKKKRAANTSRTAKNRCSISSRTPLSERITPAIRAPIASDMSS